MTGKTAFLFDSMPKRRNFIIFCGGFLLLLFWSAARLIEYFSHGLGLPCVFRTLTGFLCPGCGNTHAMIALSHGDFLAGLYYNPLYPLEFAYLIWLFVYAGRNFVLNGRFAYAGRLLPVDLLMLVIVVAWWPLRNLLAL
jgi:hypothetical protein